MSIHIPAAENPQTSDWQWRPCIYDVDYVTNGSPARTAQVLDLPQLGCPTIEVDPGTDLRIVRIRYGLLPVRITQFATIRKTAHFDGLPKPGPHPKIRFKLTMRKNWGTAPKDQWFDEAGAVFTPWVDVDAAVREVAVPCPACHLEKRWDVVRLQVETASTNQFDASAEIPIMLRPINGRAEWNIGHNLAMTVFAENPAFVKKMLWGTLALVGLLVLFALFAGFARSR